MLDRILHEAAEKYGDKTALISNGRALTYREPTSREEATRLIR